LIADGLVIAQLGGGGRGMGGMGGGGRGRGGPGAVDPVVPAAVKAVAEAILHPSSRNGPRPAVAALLRRLHRLAESWPSS